MRQVLRMLLVGVVALYITTRLIPGFIIRGNWFDFVLVAVIFMIVQKMVKPLIHLLLLPFHFITLGTLSWIVNLLALYILTFIIAKVTITEFTFQGLTTPYFAIPEMQITAFMTAMLASLCLGVCGTFFHWLME